MPISEPNTTARESGLWWFPEIPQAKYAGELAIDASEGARLRLIEERPDPSAAPPLRDYPIIHGATTSGRVVSLLQCFDLDRSWSSSCIESRTIGARLVLHDVLLPAHDAGAVFRGMHLKWPALRTWLALSGARTKVGSFHPLSFDLRYEAPPAIEFCAEDGLLVKLRLGTDKVPVGGLSADGLEISEVAWMSLVPEEPAPLSYFLDTLALLCDFFSLATLELCRPTEVRLECGAETQDRDGRTPHPMATLTTFSDRKPAGYRAPLLGEVLLPYSAISDSFPAVLSRWLLLAPQLAAVRTFYFSALYGLKVYIEAKFMSLIQALELFHRLRRPGAYLPPQDYETTIRAPLAHALPSGLPKAAKAAFLQRLSHLNEYSLSTRLKVLAREHAPILEKMVPDWKRRVREIVRARNAYTHSLGSASAQLDAQQLVHDVDFLRLLVELSLLREVGVPEERLRDCAFSCWKYQWTFLRRPGTEHSQDVAPLT